jgi:D-beta-D-heptose 7-phosphate kinase/D-beta-D-heptose 1-phosphate adenosyltransferase
VLQSELLAAVEKDIVKVKSRQEIAGICERLRASGKRIVTTNGCFDILHAAHAKLLNAAKNLGDVLVLCLNTDDSVRQLKGPDRPIMNEKERAEILSALHCVDYIVFFSEPDPRRVLAEIKPDVHAK